MNKNKNALTWILLSALIVAMDQLSKYWIVTHFTETTIFHILPFLNFVVRFNDGAAFSFLGGANGWQIYLLSAISISVSVILMVWLYRTARSNWFVAMPVSFILGGAIGNLIDRIHLGYVIDFIDFHIGNWHYATFNVADSFVCVGAIWLIVRLLMQRDSV